MRGEGPARGTLLERYVFALLTVEALLVLLHFILADVRFFDLDREYNLPTWFSGLQLSAIAAACVASFHREPRGAPLRWMWWLFVLGFLFLSFDEITVLHERVLRAETRDALPAASLLRTLPPWQIVFFPVAVAAAIAAVFFFRRRYAGRPECWRPGLGGIALWGLAFVMEGTASAVFVPRGLYTLEVALEEFFEMAGATLLLWSLARYALSPGERAAARRASPALAWAAVLGLFVALPAGAVLVGTIKERAGVHREAGQRLLTEGDYIRARDAFRAALAEDADDLEALKGLGRAAYHAGDLALAEETYRRAAAIDPEDEVVLNALDLLRVKRRSPKIPVRPRRDAPTGAP